ncbi:hypothetical protein CYANOKiyG1_55760 [Okeania sp. KiyG1]|nr:hypothetical protein CYANOKiyG1_55760 [Okeania sp. KiyG1]
MGDGEMGDGEMEKYLVIVEDGTFFYTELNGFDITPLETTATSAR